ncbi:hypothetical protein BC332_30771 [Capsicum chinense]|nr:hypothetical protein BC332_30771 [Capsicum chinense]
MGLKAKISRENTNSRRFSASYISFREDAKSFRSNILISSIVSSPGYTLRDEIDPFTYSFTTALKDGGDDDVVTGGVPSLVAGSGGEVGSYGWCSGGAGKGRATEKALTEERKDRR